VRRGLRSIGPSEGFVEVVPTTTPAAFAASTIGRWWDHAKAFGISMEG
jgi:hypothetical protein